MIFISLFVFFFALTTINAQYTEGRAIYNSGTPRRNSEIPSLPDVTNHPNLRLLDPKCGPITLRATDGNKTGVFEFPWMAQLMYYREFGHTNPESYCAGTIISSQYILTAAHCVIQLPSTYRLIGVRVGDHDINAERDCDKDEDGNELQCAEKYQEFGVECVHYHPNYSKTLLHDDIALIRLNSTIDFRPLNVKSICLPYGTAANLDHRKISYLTTSGWGRTPFGLESQVLLQEKLSLIPHEQCKQMYKPFNKTVLYNQLCTSSLNNAGSCVGNSGGPLQAVNLYNGRSARTIQYGVIRVNYGLFCDSPYPGTYTNVAYYMDWILDTMTTQCTERCAFCITFSQQMTTTTMTSIMSPETDDDSEVLSKPDVTNHPNLRLLDSECGSINQSKILSFYILGIHNDNKTKVFDFPWMALIAYDTGKPNPEFRCSGTIISSRYILTAAQCVTSLPPSLRLIGVRIGDHDTSTKRDCDKDENGQDIECAEPYQEFGVESVHYHPDYSRTLLHNDIALIRLNSTIDFRPLNVKSICLPFYDIDEIERMRKPQLIVTGWEVTPAFKRSQILLQERLSLILHQQCKEVYLRYNNKKILYKQLCAANLNNRSMCVGDVGGPLQGPGIYPTSNGVKIRIIQHGIASYGLNRCGIHPHVYTKVAYYMNWILDTMTD